MATTPNLDDTIDTAAGTTQAGKSGTATADKSKKPNKRQQNPLGNLSSYTYNLTLYMLTPEAYDAFVNTGRKNLNAIKNAANSQAQAAIANSGAGSYIIAQSGGINNESEVRAPGFHYDYYIENLKIITKTPGSSTQTATATTEITFDIVEPYGFSFISNLTRARYAILKNSKLPNAQQNTNSLKQMFVLGIRFYGYDKNGNVATTATFSAEDTINPAAQAGGGGDTALFERFFDITLTEMKFKLDGKNTVYNIKTNALPQQTAMTTRNGRINKDIQIQASTVEEALIGDNGKIVGLLTSLNRQWAAMGEKGECEIPNEYDIKFIGDEVDVRALKSASMIIDSDRDKLKSSMAATSSARGNEDLSVSEIPNLNSKQIKFKNDTSILQAISLIIGQSKFLFDAMNTVFTSKPEPDKEGEDNMDEGGKQRIKWYNLGADVKVLGYDTMRNEWAYKITYVIQPFETPYFYSPFANNPIKYYGPHKRYDYWYTGENTSVLRYEQQLNASFFTVALSGKAEEGKVPPVDQPQLVMQPQMRTPMARQGMTGEGMEAQNSYLTSLYDPSAWATAKLTILGDPDFLMNTAPNTISQVYDPYYQSDGFTINPNGGQVFIEIDFKEPEDYNNTDGLLSINESIQFVDLPKAVKSVVKGVSFFVLQCTSNFRGGNFTQDLDCNITNWAGIIKENAISDGSYERAEDARFARQGTGSATTPSGSSSTGNGLKPDPGPATTPSSGTTTTESSVPPPTTQTQQAPEDP